MGKFLPEISSIIACTFASSISNAIGDGISEDVISKGLITKNGNPGRIWDILHTSLVNTLDPAYMVAHPSKRGAWEILPIFDKQTNTLFCCMREKNFASLSRRNHEKQKRHYLYALSKAFNCDLPFLQMRLDISEDSNSDSAMIEEAIAKITNDLGIPANIISRHALILFNSVDGQLISLRCCAINSEFEIVESVDWSEYIPANSSAIVEFIDSEAGRLNDSKPKLKLKEKAETRIGRKSSVAVRQEQEGSKKLD